jgi:recombination protein RecA
MSLQLSFPEPVVGGQSRPVNSLEKPDLIARDLAATRKPPSGSKLATVLAGIVPASRLEHPVAPTVGCGVDEVDALTGGLPRGGLTEICGPASSGRTTLLLAALAEATRRQEICALVDAGDGFDPHSAAAAGVDLERLLWVRCGLQNLPQRHRDTEKTKLFIRKNQNFYCLEQALKATDLLLQGGGFGLVAMDLAGLPPECVRRVPLASWFRFRRAVEPTRTVLLVIEQEPHAKTCASLVLRTSCQSSVVSCQPTHDVSHAQLFQGIQARVEVVRAGVDVGKKPSRSAGAAFSTQQSAFSQSGF